MRIYLPASLADLASEEGLDGRAAFAVTAAVREMAPELDEEGLEYLAFLAAADAAIDLGEVSRIVVAADARAQETDATGVVNVAEVAWKDVVSIHIDDLTDPALLADIRAAQVGDDAARERANAADLLWYDAAERADVTTLLAAL